MKIGRESWLKHYIALKKQICIEKDYYMNIEVDEAMDKYRG